MKISILLPTRNGGTLLGPCIESVLSQPDRDIELVVSDNANNDETPAILANWASDPRLTVIRQDSVLTVTENWAATYRASTGAYLVLIGDDDYLLPGYFTRLRQLLHTHDMPSCLTYSAYLYMLPSTLPGHEGAYYAAPHFEINQALLAQKQLSAPTRSAIVADMFRFRPRLPLNLQSTTFSRAAAEALPHGLFKAPFPDHYALNGLLMTAPSWACAAARLLVIGVSPKSFGRFVLSDESALGFRYLGSEVELPGRLPGNELLTAMYQWLQILQRDFPEARALRISRGDYVVRQLWDWLRAWRLGVTSSRALLRRLALLTRRDWVAVFRLVADSEVRAAAMARLRLGRDDRAQQIQLGLLQAPESVNTHSEFAAFVSTAAATSPTGHEQTDHRISG